MGLALLTITLLISHGVVAFGQGNLQAAIANNKIRVEMWDASQLLPGNTIFTGLAGRFFAIRDTSNAQATSLMRDGFITVRMDGTDVVLGGTGTTRTAFQYSTSAIFERWTILPTGSLSPVEINLIITLVDERACFDLSVVNQDSTPHQVGFRFLQVTNPALGTLSAPGVGGITGERAFVGSTIPPYWRISGAQGDLTFGGTLLAENGGTTPTSPFSLVFANLFRFPQTSLYDLGPQVPITVAAPTAALYSTVTTVAPAGGSMRFVTYAGKQHATITFGERIAAGVDAEFALSYDAAGSTGQRLKPDPFKVSAFLKNQNTLALSSVRATISLPVGLELAAGETLTKTATGIGPGSSAEFTWDVRGNELASGRLTYGVSFSADPGGQGMAVTRDIEVPALPTQTFPGGLQMVSFPYSFDDPTPNVALGLSSVSFDLLRWNAALNFYEAVSAIRAGEAYWLRVSGQTPVNLVGARPVPTGAAFELKLNRDWNQIGNPFLLPVSWSDIQVINTDVNDPDFLRPLSVEEASSVQRQWISPVIYRYDLAEQMYKFDQDFGTLLRPFTGYWVRALKPTITLVIPVPTGRAARISRGQSPRQSVNDWSLRIVARGQNSVDGWNFIGVSSSSSDGYDRRDYEKPPAIQGKVQLGFVRDTWGGRSGAYAQDIQSATGTIKRWKMSVSSPNPGEEVTLSWPEINGLPRGYELFVTDDATGHRYMMRQTSSLRVNTGQNGSRAFTITAEPTSRAGAFRIVNASVVPSRSRSSAAIAFTPTQDANFTIRILNGAGAPLRTLTSRSAAAGNMVTINWDYRDGKGIALPAGSYTIEIRGTTPDGQSARAILPHIVTR
jgi:hypothetical protein